MASKAKAAAPVRSMKRGYTVVKVESDTKLTVLAGCVQAKSQADAMQQTVDGLQPSERNGVFGAFLYGSYREKSYSSAQTWATSATDREPGFGVQLSIAVPEES